ncbi:hypothetical protein TNCV_2824751 [Trichonephila clavipes]|nr:hypothetical protein TNCV_2824751 [Trichonephila clavipes]
MIRLSGLVALNPGLVLPSLWYLFDLDALGKVQIPSAISHHQNSKKLDVKIALQQLVSTYIVPHDKMNPNTVDIETSDSDFVENESDTVNEDNENVIVEEDIDNEEEY